MAQLDEARNILISLPLDAQMEIINALKHEVQRKKRNITKASYTRERYHNDDNFKMKTTERTNQYIANKYATDPEWREHVRNQQRQYYHRKKQRQRDTMATLN